MKDQITSNLNNPELLEQLFRKNKNKFKQAFEEIFDNIREQPVARYWRARFRYDISQKTEISWGSNLELVFVILASLLAGLIAKLPAVTGIDEEFFYPRNMGFVIFPCLTVYFLVKNNAGILRFLLLSAVTIIAIAYINFLPLNDNSDTLILACIHLPLFLWSIMGIAFAGKDVGRLDRRLAYLRYNGDLVVLTAIFILAGVILTVMTVFLFNLIDVNIIKIYMEYIVVFGLAASPILATYVTQTNPELVNKVSPVVARIFSPLVLITLVIYLGAVMVTCKDPYNDRDFLIAFNLLLIGVMAIVVFSIAETSKRSDSLNLWILTSLSAVTIVINIIALSAIIFRINEWGITPNRMAVLGGNLLVFFNLMLIFGKMIYVVRGKNDTRVIEDGITSFLPAYALWTIVVSFIFPVVFGFR